VWWADQREAYSAEFQALIDNLELVPNTLEPPSAV